MKWVKTLCDCCEKEMKAYEMSAPNISILVKQDSVSGNVKSVPINITVPGYDICNNCLFRAIDNSRVTVKDNTR